MKKAHSAYIGSYKIIKKIGEGGMGEVFLVEDLKNSREIALKKRRTDKNDSVNAKEHFLKEATINSILSHPAILPVYEVFDQGDLTHYTMPFIHGSTLKQHLSDQLEHAKIDKTTLYPANIPFVLNLFTRLCQVVAYAHSKGILHRDLKPSNILLGNDNEIYLLDWGLAKKIHETNGKNDTDQLFISGTIAYLAPEIFIGKPWSVQSEIYSLGVILYEMLTLRNPFHRNNIDEYMQNFDKEILVDPVKLAPYWKIPPYLSNIALKCLDAPEKRYSSVEEILKELKKGNEKGLSQVFRGRGAFGVRSSRCALLFKEFKNQDLIGKAQQELRTPNASRIHNPAPDYENSPLFLDLEKFKGWDKENQRKALSIHQSFLSKKTEMLVDFIHSEPIPLFPLIGQALMALIVLGSYQESQRALDFLFQKILDVQAFSHFQSIQSVLMVYQRKRPKISYRPDLPKRPKNQDLEPVFLVLEEAFRREQMEAVSSIVDFIVMKYNLNLDQLLRLDCYLIWSFLFSKKWEEARKVFDFYKESHPNFPLLSFLEECIDQSRNKNKLMIPEKWRNYEINIPDYIRKPFDN